MRLGETPVHIPNTLVKTQAADDTMLETAWESRWLPDHLKKGDEKESVLVTVKKSEAALQEVATQNTEMKRLGSYGYEVKAAPSLRLGH